MHRQRKDKKTLMIERPWRFFFDSNDKNGASIQAMNRGQLLCHVLTDMTMHFTLKGDPNEVYPDK